MKKDNRILIIAMAAGLLLAMVLAVFLDPGVQTALSQPHTEYDIIISEICAKNETLIPDNSGAYPDYIELYNNGEAVSLAGFRLTDGSATSAPLGDIRLGAGEYRVIFLSNALTGFALSASGGDAIQLQDPAGNIVAQTKVSAMSADQVMLYYGGIYVTSGDASPGFANDAAGLAAFRQGSPAADPRIVISELLISNATALADEKGSYCDIIELYNASEEPVWLGGYALSDSPDSRFRYRLPEMELPAGGYTVIYCDGENYVSEDGHIHANFGISLNETVCLTDPQGGYVTLTAEYTEDNISLALGESGYEKQTASLGYPNTEEGGYLAAQARVDDDAALVISEVLLSSSGVPYEGAIQDVVEIWNRSGVSVSTRGWYLSDGGDPYQYPLPEQTLEPGEYMVVVCRPEITGFALSRGETVYLTGPNYLFAPPVPCEDGEPGKTISLQPDSVEAAYDFAPVTLGYDNLTDSHERFMTDTKPQGLMISEVMTDNVSYLYGPYANTCDWVELYNNSDETIHLSDYCLTDSADALTQYALPDKTLDPGKYIVILLSETGKNLRQGYSWLPFSLSSAGDRLYLTRSGRVEDYVILPELAANTSYGRPGGSYGFCVLAGVSVAKQNGDAARISAMPQAQTEQGAYDGVEYLEIAFSGAGEIYYTTDCTVPNRYDTRYTGPIRITQTTVFRVVCYEEGCQRSQVLDLTYLVNENDNLSTVCLVTDPANLWDPETGMYVFGVNDAGPYPYKGANYWRNWERKTTISLFETDGSVGFSTTCGLKIFGGYTRTQGKKSLACMFRSKYGDGELDYPLFGEEGLDSYETFVLRCGGQDAYGSRIRDEVITSLAGDYLQMPVQKYRPVVLYLNGEYWGIYFIREKINEQYVAGNFNESPDDVVRSVWTGDGCAPYLALRNYARSHDLRDQQSYEYVLSQINEQNYMDFWITQLWTGNADAGNVKFFRTTELEWHWILYDMDLAFWQLNYNPFNAYLKNANLYSMDMYSRTLLLTLQKNPEFKEAFLRRAAWQLKTVWNEETVVARIDEIAAQIQPDMQKECDRWGTRYSNWEISLTRLRTFAADRTEVFLKQLKTYFGLTDSQMREYGFEV